MMANGSRPLLLLLAATLAASVALSCGKKDHSAAVDSATTGGRPRPAVAPGELPANLVDSTVSLRIIKDRNPDAPVNATVKLRDGALALSAGTARLSIDLDSFDSGLPLRDQRVRTIFFETAKVGWETVELKIAKLPAELLATLRDRKPVSGVKLSADLALHGATAQIAFVVDAGATTNGGVWVKSAEPLLVKISDFALGANLKSLSALCQHNSIEDVVSIEFSLEFSPP